MSFEDLHTKIGAYISNNFSEVRLQWDNDDGFTPNNEEYWLRITILPGRRNRASVGSRSNYLDREPGVVTAQVLGPSGLGDGRHLELADNFAALFRGSNDQLNGTSPTITFRSPYTRRVGPVDEGTRYQLNVVVPFEADHIVGGA